MRAEPLKLTLLVPGLVGSLPGGDTTTIIDEHCPGLARLLARARGADSTGDSDSLRYRLLGYASSDVHDLPAAWLSYQFDTGRVPPDALLRADPVHLRADQTRLLLFAADQLNITIDEAQALCEAFNRHCAADGLRLEWPTTVRGYLHLRTPSAVRTTPLEQAVGRSVDGLLPRGPDARRWHGFMNEVQMLFHDHPVNRAREARGQPMINGLWLWGGGRPLNATASDWQRIWSDDPVLRGLAWLNGINGSGTPVHAGVWLGDVVDGHHLVTLEALRRPAAYADTETWLSELERLEHDWFLPLARALWRGRLRELRLYPDDGRVYRVSRWQLLRVWKRALGANTSSSAGSLRSRDD